MVPMTTTLRTFELRTYRSAPGKLEALSARFRNHTMGLFARHKIEVVGFWSATDAEDPTTGTLVYVCAYESRPAADAAWEGFREDPDWQAAKAASEVDGSLTSSVDSLYLEPTDYSPIS